MGKPHGGRGHDVFRYATELDFPARSRTLKQRPVRPLTCPHWRKEERRKECRLSTLNLAAPEAVLALSHVPCLILPCII